MINSFRAAGTVAAAIAIAIAAVAAPATAATTVTWTGGGDFDDGVSTSFAPVVANSVSFANVNYAPGTSVYSSAGAHSHGQALTFTINATIDGVLTTIYSQYLVDDAEQLLVDLGTIGFASGSVTSIGFGCDNCSYNTFHGFGYDGETSFTLASSAPEAATWAMLIAGFGLTGATARRRRTVAA